MTCSFVHLPMVDNIQSVTRKAYCALANIGKIRRDLTRPAAETLVNACVTSVMDYANSTCLVSHKCTQTVYRDYRVWQLVLSVVVVHVIMLHH